MMRTSKLVVCALGLTLLTLALASPVDAETVEVEYIADLATVLGTPFGLSPPLGTKITGSFTYETTTPDTNSTPDFGEYPHSGGGAFSATITGFAVTITGSNTPFLQIENGTRDVFRFIDGPRIAGAQGGIMSINGVPDAGITLWMAMVDIDGSTMPDESLPSPFPFMFPGPAHTFFLEDDQGTLLLQFDSATTQIEASSWGRMKALYR